MPSVSKLVRRLRRQHATAELQLHNAMAGVAEDLASDDGLDVEGLRVRLTIARQDVQMMIDLCDNFLAGHEKEPS